MRAIVVGGGFAGLAAALRLADDGAQVTLVEKRPQLGGRAYSLVDETTGDTIDNGQHLFMGCYRATRNFLRRIGAEHKLRLAGELDVAFADGPARARLRALPLPPPLHLAGGLLALEGLGLRDRLALVKVALSVKWPTAQLPAPSDWETVDAWLDRLGQSAAARRLLWHPLALATLNDDPRTASAKMLAAVIGEGLLGGRDEARLGWASVGLSELYVDDAARTLGERGAELRTGVAVERIVVEHGVARGVTLRGGERLSADAVIAAVPPRALSALVPDEARAPYFDQLLRLEGSPIVSVHLWLDRQPMQEALLGLVGRALHWAFNRNRLAPATRGHVVSLVASAAAPLVDRSTDEIVALAQAELARAVPEAAGARLLHARVIKEREATIAHPAGGEALRPRPRSPVDGLFVAGDFVRTGLPATIESAVRSAEEAAALALAYTPPPRVTAPPPAPADGVIPLGRLRRTVDS